VNQLGSEEAALLLGFLSIGELWDVFLSWANLAYSSSLLKKGSCHAVSETILLYSKIPSQEVFMKNSRYVAHHVLKLGSNENSYCIDE
jgi:hypothetical protein